MLKAFVFEEGKLVPVSQGTRTFLNPVGFTGEFRPRPLGSLCIPKPMAVMGTDWPSCSPALKGKLWVPKLHSLLKI